MDTFSRIESRVCSALLGGQVYNGWADTQSLPNITAALFNTSHNCIKKIMYIYNVDHKLKVRSVLCNGIKLKVAFPLAKVVFLTGTTTTNHAYFFTLFSCCFCW